MDASEAAATAAKSGLPRAWSTINNLAVHNGRLQTQLNSAAARVISSGWFALGREVESFEKSFAAWCGATCCRGVANGTDALELALRAAGVRSGDEVVLAANAGMYSTTAIMAIGARPVYADVSPESWNIDPQSVLQVLSPATRAIIATHLYGLMCDMPRLRQLANQQQLTLLEDCAQSHGAAIQNQKCGTWGDIAAFSFYPTKNLGALGDAGAIVTNRDDLFTAITQLRQYGWERRYHAVQSGGRNSRLDELQAAFLTEKLPCLDQWVERRRAIGRYYSEHIHHPLVTVIPYADQLHAYHLYVVRCKRRDALRKWLTGCGIATDIHYPSLDYQQPCMAALGPWPTLPVSELLVQEILTLPCYPELTLADADFIVRCINRWID